VSPQVSSVELVSEESSAETTAGSPCQKVSKQKEVCCPHQRSEKSSPETSEAALIAEFSKLVVKTRPFKSALSGPTDVVDVKERRAMTHVRCFGTRCRWFCGPFARPSGLDCGESSSSS
jgi:hypothetical protein